MAGTRAMNGEASSATTPMHAMAERHPGSARAARTPSAIRDAIEGWPATGSGRGRRTSSRAPTTAPKESALMPKTKA